MLPWTATDVQEAWFAAEFGDWRSFVIMATRLKHMVGAVLIFASVLFCMWLTWNGKGTWKPFSEVLLFVVHKLLLIFAYTAALFLTLHSCFVFFLYMPTKSTLALQLCFFPRFAPTKSTLALRSQLRYIQVNIVYYILLASWIIRPEFVEILDVVAWESCYPGTLLTGKKLHGTFLMLAILSIWTRKLYEPGTYQRGFI